MGDMINGEQERSVGVQNSLCGSQCCCHCYTVNTLRITGLFSGGCLFLLEVTSVPLGVIFHILSYQVVTSYNTSASSLPPLIIPMAGHSSSVF